MWPTLLNVGSQTVTADRQIGPEKDHDIRFQVRLLREHGSGVAGILKHLELTIRVR